MNKFQWNHSQNSYISFNKMPLKISSGKWRPFCLGKNVLIKPVLTCTLVAENDTSKRWGRGYFKWNNVILKWSTWLPPLAQTANRVYWYLMTDIASKPFWIYMETLHRRCPQLMACLHKVFDFLKCKISQCSAQYILISLKPRLEQILPR